MDPMTPAPGSSDIADVVARSAGGPPDVQAMGEVMRRHGLTPAPPPAG